MEDDRHEEMWRRQEGEIRKCEDRQGGKGKQRVRWEKNILKRDRSRSKDSRG